MNKWVFSHFLQVSRLAYVCKLSCSSFHLVGPYVLKAQLVNVFLFVVGISSRLCLLDLRPSLLCSFLTISSYRHFRACLLSDLNTSMNIFFLSILC